MLTHGNMTIYKYFEKQTNRFGEKPFLLFEDETITYLEMFERINRTASWLKEKGIQKGDIVSVILKNSPTFYEIWFACGALGAIFLPINIASTKYELQYFLEHSESKGILFDQEFVTSGHKEVIDQFNLLFAEETSDDWKNEINKQSKQKHNEDVNADDVAAIMYTSGTTAKPKGVMITHENYLFAGHSSVLYQQLSPDDRYLIFLPLYHANSQYYTSMATLVAGGTIILLETFSASTFWQQVARYKPTVTSLVATVIKILLRREEIPEEKQNTIKRAGYGLFVPTNEIYEFEKRFGIKLIQWFGMTESITTNITTPLYETMVEDDETGILSIGKPALGHEVKIVDENGKELPFGEVGEIIIKGPSFMKGYYKNEAETKKTIRDGWLYTGDNGYMDEEGNIWFVDRNKDMIKRAGVNISSVEIENVLMEHPSVKFCAVIGVPDEIREEKVVAYIETDDQNLTENEMIKFCKERLSAYKIPQEVYFVDEFPRTSIGKIQKHILRKQYLEK